MPPVNSYDDRAGARPGVSVSGGGVDPHWSVENESSRGSGRLEAFSDAVIAIMLTVLTLRLLEFDPRAIEREGLAYALLRQWPSYLAFLLTFLVVGQVWVTHHNLWRYITRVDQGLLIINLVLLFFVTVIPLAARLLAEGIKSPTTADGRLAVGCYAAMSLGQAMSFNFGLWWARRRGLLSGKMGDDLYCAVRRRFLIGPSIYLFALLVDLISPWISLLSYLGVIALYIWPGPGDLPSTDNIISGQKSAR